MMALVRVTMPCTLTRVSMSSGFRSRIVRALSRLYTLTCTRQHIRIKVDSQDLASPCGTPTHAS